MLRAKLSSLDAKAVQAANLGTFYIKERALDASIQKSKNMLSHFDQSTIKGYEIVVDVKERLFKMEYVKELLNQERQRQKEIINKRFGNVSEQKFTDHMEKQEPDS